MIRIVQKIDRRSKLYGVSRGRPVEDNCIALWIRILHEFRIKLEQWILAIIKLHLLTAGFSCSDPLKPVAKAFVQRVINSNCERQQVCDIDSQVIEVWVILIVQIGETNISGLSWIKWSTQYFVSEN